MANNTVMHLKYNFFYVTLFLIVGIILLLTRQLSELPNLVEYILFALAITSITLSIITIIYSIYSNYSLTHSIHTINEASDSLNKNTNRLESTLDLVNTNILNIPSKVAEIGRDIKEGIGPAISEVLEKNKIEAEASESEIDKKDDLKLTKKSISSFFLSNSLIGVFIGYVAFLSHKYKKTFLREEIASIIGGGAEHLWGQFIAQSAFEIFDFEEIPVEGKIYGKYRITTLSDNFKTQIENLIDKKIDRFVKKNYPSDLKTRKEEFLNTKKELEEYFKK